MKLSPLAAEFYPASYHSAEAEEELVDLERVDAWLSLMADLDEEDEMEEVEEMFVLE